MIARDDFQLVIAAICRHTGYNSIQILESYKEEHTDARHLLIYFLLQRGLSESQISSVTKLTRQCINRAKNNFDERIKHKHRLLITMQQISNELSME